jgi:DNA processing protein
MITSTEKLYWLALAKVPHIGPLRFKLLIEFFGSAAKVWSLSHKEIQETGLPKDAVASLLEAQQNLDPQQLESELVTKNIAYVCRYEDTFPALLKEVADCPPVLFYRGVSPTLFEQTIAVVGTRRPTPYGRMVTERLTSELVQNGFTIVSGLALGVDALAHRTALEMHGDTIAVLGSGVDMLSPQSNVNLGNQILEDGGSIVSEYWPGIEANAGTFPARNRIISGLSKGVLIVEGAEDSGSLITARSALEQNREVFAVPGPITSSLSVGPMSLIKQGAKLVTTIDDILEDLNQSYPLSSSAKQASIQLTFDSETENKIYQLVKEGKGHIDDIVREIQEPVSRVVVTLTSLELRGYIKANAAKAYTIV